MDEKEIQRLIGLYSNDPLEILRALGGFYACPKNADGKRLGPLVGYAGTYAKDMHYVGDIYANFAAAEAWPRVLSHYASGLAPKIERSSLNIDIFCGMPMGGIAFATMLGLICEKRFCFMEKKVTRLADEGGREESQLILGRHEIKEGDRIAIVEDVTNNFSTTAKACEVITSKEIKGVPVAVVSFLNRSVGSVQNFVHGGIDIPVVSLVTRAIPQFKQDDPEVVEDVKAGNVAWKAKQEWPRLMKAMEEAKSK